MMDFWSYWTGFYIGLLVGVMVLGSILILHGQLKLRRSIRQKKAVQTYRHRDVQSVTVTEEMPEELKMMQKETEKTTAYLEGDCPCGGGHLRKDHYGQRADLTGKEPRCLDCGGGLNAVIGVHGREICRECKRIFVTDESAKGFDRENLWGHRPGTRGGETVGPVERILTKSENLSSNQGGKTSKQ